VHDAAATDHENGDDYGPTPRSLANSIHAGNDQAIANLAVVN
jgi:hypothetical protein